MGVTIGYCVRDINNDSFYGYIKHLTTNLNTSYNIEIIRKECNDGNISKCYNQILNESTNNLVLLMHDDIYIFTYNFVKIIDDIFIKNEEFGVIGVWGGDFYDENLLFGGWGSNGIHGRILIGGKSHEFNVYPNGHIENETEKSLIYLESYEDDGSYLTTSTNQLSEVVTIDGIFISIRKDRIKQNFDENLSSFHFYDVCFGIDNFINGVKIGTTKSLNIFHKKRNEIKENNDYVKYKWTDSKLYYLEKYKDKFPFQVKHKSSCNGSYEYKVIN